MLPGTSGGTTGGGGGGGGGGDGVACTTTHRGSMADIYGVCLCDVLVL